MEIPNNIENKTCPVVSTDWKTKETRELKEGKGNREEKGRYMEKLELIFEILKSSSNGIKTSGFLDGRIIKVNPEFVDEREESSVG